MNFPFLTKNQLLLVVLVSVVLFIGCAELLGAEKLGDRIFRDGDVIVFTKTESYDGVGIATIPPKVVRVEKDDRHVVVQTLNKRNEVRYWLIDKTAAAKELHYIEEDSLTQNYYKFSNVYGPLDSSDFARLYTEKRVTVKWKDSE